MSAAEDRDSLRAAPVEAARVFGRNIRAVRQSRGWNLRETAPLLGMRFQNLARIEAGEGTTLATAGRIAAGLGVPLTRLLAACGECLDAPRPGLTCQECGTPGPAVTG